MLFRSVDAISKDRADVKKVLRRCLLSILLVAVVVALILYTGSDLISQHWLYDSRTAQPLRLLSLSLPFIAMSAALSGYFTAIRRAGVYAGVQVLEQLVRVASTAGFLHMLSGRGLEASCIAIVLGSCVSDLISFLASFFLSKWMVRRQRNQHRVMLHLNRRLLRIAVPDAVGAWVRSILLTIEHLLIPIGFKKSGISSENALATYGTIHAMTLPVDFENLFFLMVRRPPRATLFPYTTLFRAIINRVLYAALLFSLLVAGVFYAYAGELSNAVYHSSDTKPFLQLLAVLVPVMYLDMAVDGMLKGLDQQLSSMRYNIIDSGLCVILVYFLIPRYSVKGYIITLFVSEILNFYLSLRRLIRVSTLRLNWRRILNPILCMTCAVTGVRLVATLLPAPLLHSVPWLVGAILATSCAYLLALRCSGGITQQDLHWFAGIFRSERKAAMSVSPQNTGVSI